MIHTLGIETPDQLEGGGPSEPGSEFRCGFVAIVGKPNVGKSTLLNRFMEQKLAAVSPKPQTTRNRILGVRNVPGAQLVFLDTPGIHKPATRMAKAMVDTAVTAMGQVDVVLLVVEAPLTKENVADDVFIPADIQELARRMVAQGKPCVVALNKIDRLKDRRRILPSLQAYGQLLPEVSVVPVSALKDDGVQHLMTELVGLLPQGPALYPEDMMTDRAERFFVAEWIREQVFLLLAQEVPYSTEVEITGFQEGSGRVTVHANLLVERDSQKKILIGKGGSMIKEIGTRARQEIEQMLDAKVTLHLFVKVEKDWRRSGDTLERVGIIES